MKLSTAKKILNENQIFWSNYFDLQVAKGQSFTKEVKEAINIVQSHLLNG